MKYVIVLGDGMSDYLDANNQTPLILSDKPNIDKLAAVSELGLCQTVPVSISPGSDTANLSVMGYDPLIYYSGRSPLEAVSMGISLNDNDVAYRLNLVTLSDEKKFSDKVMLDYSAGEIVTSEAKKIIELLQSIVPKNHELYDGISYRHCLVRRNGKTGAILEPPHNISGQKISNFLPKEQSSEELASFMIEASKLLSSSPLNKTKANAVWIWGEGRRPSLPCFYSKHGKSGAVISAVDLIKGIGKCAGMTVIDVEGATGTINTNFDAKAAAAIDALKSHDFVYIHLEAPDECAHHGDKENKIKSISLIDKKIVKPIVEHLNTIGGRYKILVIPDHATPLSLKTHVHDPVPYLLFDSKKAYKGAHSYNEMTAKESNILINPGYKMIERLFED